MGREVRRVPSDWVHPGLPGYPIPLFDGSDLARRTAEWDEGAAHWERGFRTDHHGGWIPREKKYKRMSYVEWDGWRPDPDHYMPEWPESAKTHYQMYETCTEGTPISPVFATIEELARWLADNDASAFGDMTATYEQWLATCQAGVAPSLVITNGIMESGVEHCAKVCK